PFLVEFMLAGSATALATIASNPMEVVKTRMQLQGELAGKNDRLAYRSFRHALYMIGKTEGIRGLQSGLVAGMAYNSDNTIIMLTAAAVSGLVVTTCMHPFDVVATRLSNQPVVAGRGQLYSGVVDCLRKTWATEGLRGLCKGWTAHYFRVGPHTMFTFVLWEQLQRLAHEVAGL
ncbi:hypothetical protein DYB26_001358, partial [Aphanomyces astaci]